MAGWPGIAPGHWVAGYHSTHTARAPVQAPPLLSLLLPRLQAFTIRGQTVYLIKGSATSDAWPTVAEDLAAAVRSVSLPAGS
jgi:hypothetical protein